MQKKLIILIITFFIFNCESKVDSVGHFNEIIIVTSMNDRDLIFPYLNSIFSKQINTPTEENIFMVKWVDANNFFKYKYYKNIVFISLKKPIDKTADLLIEKFRKAGNNEKIYASYDRFSKDQLFLTIDAYDSIDLSDIVRKHKNWIYDLFDDEISKRLFSLYQENGLNETLSTIMKDEFSVFLPIDENFQLIKKTDRFMWVGRGYPYRWITVHTVKADEMNNLLDQYKELITSTMSNVSIADEFLQLVYKDDLIILRGLYEHNESDTGGPFFSYIIKNNINNELTFISGFVNNPGKSKYYLLKQLESLISINIKGNIK